MSGATAVRRDVLHRLRHLTRTLTEVPDETDELGHLDALAGRDPVEVTIGIATFDDFDGAFFTIEALLLFHPEVLDRAEILLIDNHPAGVEKDALRRLAQAVPRLHYVPVRSVTSTAVRDLVFRLAAGEVVVVLDSHVLVRAGGLEAVVDHLARPGCRDLIQGPLLTYDAGTLIGTHWTPTWSAGMFGKWSIDERGVDPAGVAFEIPLQGLGVFACRRDAWPGLNPRFSGFGGEEGYVHEKVRRGGGRVMCLPALRWVHRFDRPHGVRYPLRWEHRVRNYLVGWSELGLDVAEVEDHFTGFLGPSIRPHIDRVTDAMNHDLWRYDGVIVINDDLQPGRYRRTRDVMDTIALEPRRLTPVVAGEGRASVDESVAAATRYGRHWGWSRFLVIGDDVLQGADDLTDVTRRLDRGQSSAVSTASLLVEIGDS